MWRKNVPRPLRNLGMTLKYFKVHFFYYLLILSQDSLPLSILLFFSTGLRGSPSVASLVAGLPALIVSNSIVNLTYLENSQFS